jgi:hypothetical protein
MLYEKRVGGVYSSALPPDLNVSYQGEYQKFRQVITPDEKARIFGESLGRLRDCFIQNEITIPSNILDRLFILNKYDYSEVRVRYGAFGGVHKGFVSDGVAFLSHEHSTEDAELATLTDDQGILDTGLHELLHLLEHDEQWILKDPKYKKPVLDRRQGIVSSRPFGEYQSEEDRMHTGMHNFQEGFTDYFSSVLTGLKDISGYSYSYGPEVDVVAALINKIGITPVIMGTYTKAGFRTLFTAIESRFGLGSFRNIFRTMGFEFDEWYRTRTHNGPKRSYPQALKIINGE